MALFCTLLTVRAGLVAVTLLFFAAGEISACTLLDNNTTPFFESKDIGKGVDADVVFEITILSVEPIRPPVAAMARVDRVFKGQVDRPELRVVTEGSSCAYGFAVGVRGIVMGVLTRDANGNLVLQARNESYGERRVRRERFRIEQ
jgi:hypothetical protein